MSAVAGAVVRSPRVYLLPTRHGLYFALVLTAMLLAAVNYANGLAYLFTFTLASVAIVSMIYTHRNVARLELKPGTCTPVFVGQDAVFPVHVHNASSQPCHGVWVHAGTFTTRVSVAARNTAQVDLHLPALKRGQFVLPPVAVSTRFPLGLVFAWRRGRDLGAVCLVYPRPGSPENIVPGDGASPGRVRIGHEPEGDDFAGVREFHPGDPPRHVDWKAVARGRGMHTKQFDNTGGRTVWLDWEMFAPMPTEKRLSALCRAVLDADREEMRYGLRLPGRRIAPASGARHLRECLSTLALWEG